MMWMFMKVQKETTMWPSGTSTTFMTQRSPSTTMTLHCWSWPFRWSCPTRGVPSAWAPKNSYRASSESLWAPWWAAGEGSISRALRPASFRSCRSPMWTGPCVSKAAGTTSPGPCSVPDIQTGRRIPAKGTVGGHLPPVTKEPGSWRASSAGGRSAPGRGSMASTPGCPGTTTGSVILQGSHRLNENYSNTALSLFDHKKGFLLIYSNISQF